jgi:hypothetical protein
MAAVLEGNSTAPTLGEARQRQKSVGLVEIVGPGGRKQVLNLEEINEADAQLAAEFGYKPVFKREFGYLSTFSFAVSISGLFSTIMTTISYPLHAGGSAAAVWCWLISGAGCMCIAVSSDLTPLYLSARILDAPARRANNCTPRALD